MDYSARLRGALALRPLVLGLLVFLPAAAAAQLPPVFRDTVVLTLDAAVQRALARGAEMRVAHSQVLEADGRIREAFAGALPQVTGSLVYTRQFASIYQGAAVIGGLITSTLLTLVVVPVVYSYLDDFGVKVSRLMKRWTGAPGPASHAAEVPAD